MQKYGSHAKEKNNGGKLMQLCDKTIF